jgi:hypothetical protein
VDASFPNYWRCKKGGDRKRLETMLVMMAGGAPTCPSAPVAKFLVPERGNIVDSGIGLSYRPDRLHTQAVGPVRQPCAGVDYIPQSWKKNLASGIESFARGGGSLFAIL